MDSRWQEPFDVGRCLLPLPTFAALLLGWLFFPATVWAQTIEFHVPGGDATLTLNEFSRQANLQLLFDFKVVKGRFTQPVDGTFEPRDALRRMLASSGLVFDFVNERTLAVTPLQTGSAAGTASTPSKQPQRPNAASVAHAAGSNDLSLGGMAIVDTVRVTGTNVRGEFPVGEHVVTLDKEEIDNSGATSLSDLLRVLPQVFGGGPTQDTRQIGIEAQTNSGYGSGINLRGLGARATLVLINGRRLAPGGSEAAFVDIDNIPLSAVERVDVLPDSASALYGADAVGGVVNIVMRERYSGAETVGAVGTGTRNSLKNYLVAQTLGHNWDSANALVTLEFYRRDALPASDRSYAVSDLTHLGGGNFDTMMSNPGTLLVGNTTYAIPRGQDGTHLSAASLVPNTANLQNKYADADILPEQRRWSLYATGRKSFDDSFSVFTDVLLVDREAKNRTGGVTATLAVPSSNPFYVNPTGGTDPILVGYNFIDDLGPGSTDVTIKTTNVTVGVDFNAGKDWKITPYVGYAREREDQMQYGLLNFGAVEAALADSDPDTAFNPFGDGSHTNRATLKSFTMPWLFALDSQLKVADLSADGPLMKLPGGTLKLAMGLDLRDQFYHTLTPPSLIAPESVVNLSRRTSAAFTEIILPLFGKDNAQRGLNKLEVSAAARYEDFAGFGHATTPKYGLVWAPVASLSFRGTWSRSFRAPSLSDLDESLNTVIPEALPDSKSPTGVTNVLVWSGANSNLRQERATSWTAGLDYAPEQIKGFTIALTWFDIAFKDRIQATDFTADILDNPAYSILVSRSPSSTAVNYVCNHGIYFMGTTADCAALGPAIGAIVDLRVHNIETLSTRGIDFNIKYETQAPIGKLGLALDGTYLLSYALAEGNGAPETDFLNTQNNPLNLRFRGTLNWTGKRFGFTGGVNYSNSYRNTEPPAMPVSSWTTVDAQIRYVIGADPGNWLAKSRIEFNATNLFNHDPPFLNNQVVGIGYDQENADPYGRMISLRIRKSW